MPKIKENGILYISEKYNIAIHKCCCGCGTEQVTPLGDASKDHEWGFVNIEGKITLTPSLLNQYCKSHYFIQGNEIIWC